MFTVTYYDHNKDTYQTETYGLLSSALSFAFDIEASNKYKLVQILDVYANRRIYLDGRRESNVINIMV